MSHWRRFAAGDVAPLGLRYRLDGLLRASSSGSCVSCGPFMALPTIRYDTDMLAWANSVEFDPKPAIIGRARRQQGQAEGDAAARLGEVAGPADERRAVTRMRVRSVAQY